MSERAAWVALSLLRQVGSRTLEALLQRFGSAQAVLTADDADLRAVHGIGVKTAAAIQAIQLERVEAAITTWQRNGVQIITRHEPSYPDYLNTIHDPPPTLFARGNYQPDKWQQAVAIVGTRRPTAQAAALATRVAERLAAQGWTIVSGLALGIDAAAHRGALSASQQGHVAVLGGGVLNLYPPPNRLLAERLCERGAILSENHPQATSTAPRLVARNRIISGLAQHVIIIESDTDGGAMYAARAAQSQGRTLHTLDLPASGNQALIADGVNVLDPLRLDL